MRTGRTIAMAAAMLTAAPAMAAPIATTSAPSTVTGNPAASLSVSNSLRAGAKTEHDSQFTFLLGFLLFIGFSLGVTAAAGGFSSSN